MKKTFVYIVCASSIMLLSSCVHFLPIALDTAEDNDPYYVINGTKNPDYKDKFTATDIYTDIVTATWGMEKDACREFITVDSVKKAGSASLLMTWDKSKKGCDWIGIGWAWNNWQVVDMSNVIDTWAVRFWVRTKQGKLPNVPLTLNFLDDGNKNSENITVSNKFYKGDGIDENWKEVIIPLTYFRFVPKGMNLTGISQIIMTFEGSASIYFDEFQLIDLKTVAPGSTDLTTTNRLTAPNVFTEDVKNTWGIESNSCKDFKTVTDVKKNGNTSLYLSWDKSKKSCDVITAGFAWNNWQDVNFSGITDSYALHFWIRTKSGKQTTIPINISFIDDGSITTKPIQITNKYYKGDGIDENWKEVTIPLSEFRFKEDGLNLFEISQLIMTFEGTNAVYLDDIQFIQDLQKTKK